MSKQIALILDGYEVGQILDCLSLRVEAWEETCKYLRGEESAHDYIVEECSGADEAERMANCYRAIIANVRAQRNAQK